MTTPNEELISMLRAKGCPDWVTARWLMESAADLLQSQAERIAMLESLNELAVKQAETLGKQHDTLRAQIAAIAATEPESIATDQTDEFGEVIYREVYTRPMPAQGVEASLIKLPEPEITLAWCSWTEKWEARELKHCLAREEGDRVIGYTEAQLKQAVRDALDTQDVEDAARYRWLREQHWSTDTIAVVLNPKQAVKLGYVCPSDSLLDETIDAAIAKGAK